MQRRTPVQSLAEQVETRSSRPAPELEPDDTPILISTGSTLLDLAISGLRYERGGLPGGILVEIFGPSGCGKTVILCELAGGVQRQGGEVKFRDPEGRLNSQFAQLFDFRVEEIDYSMPDTVTDVFGPIEKWEPRDTDKVNGIFTDSLAALSTKMEMDAEDKMGMRRAKELSTACRKVCRLFPKRNILMVCSNQVRQNADAGPFQEKYTAPGGEAIKFYSSVRLRCHSPEKMTRIRKVGGTDQKRVHGVQTRIEVVKNSVSAPYKSADVYIDFEYGIDDVRGCLEYLKRGLGISTYNVLGDGVQIGAQIERAIREVEENDLQARLRARTAEVWREVESKFTVARRPKVRI